MDADTLRVSLLGPFEVRVGGRLVGPAGGRRRGLLAVLALDPGSVIPTQTLVDRVWGQRPPASAPNLVQTYVSTWRKSLGGHGTPVADSVETVGAGYRLCLVQRQLDLLEFRGLASSARQAADSGHHSMAASQYEAALTLWRGPALVDLTSEEWHSRLARPLDAERVSAVEAWARSSLSGGGDPARVIAALHGYREDEPLREQLTELMMWALSVGGRQAEALQIFESTRRLLRDELGADPGSSLRTMQARVLEADPALQARTSVVPVRSVPPEAVAEHVEPRTPVAPETLVGREQPLLDVERLLDRRRLVTLTGPGGCGKTRLASELVGRRRAGSGRAWFTELATLSEVGRVPSAIAAAIGLQVTARSDPELAVARRLADLDGLLVLDNAEHLDGMAALVDRLLRSTAGLRILVTSRRPLGLSDEQRFVVPLLAVPRSAAGRRPMLDDLEQNDSVRLLLDRARQHDPGLRLTAENAGAIAEVARLLDGLPLALEIAGAWIWLMGPAALLSHLHSCGLDVRTRRSDAPARHRSMRDSIAWSFALLTPDQQRLLCRLSVFSGGFDLAAVQAVCSPYAHAVVEQVYDLVDRNLVQVTTPVAQGPRLSLLQPVRDFADGRLTHLLDADVAGLRARHTAWFESWAAELAAHSEGTDSPVWLARAVADADNLRLAMDHLLERGESVRHLQLVVDAMVLWFEAGLEGEGRDRLARALAETSADVPTRAIGLTYWAWLREGSDRGEAAHAALTAVELAREADDPLVEAFALQTLGETIEDPRRAAATSRAAFDAADRAGSRQVRYGPTAPDAVRCGASSTLAALAVTRSVPEALRWQKEAVRRAELEGDPRIIAVNCARLAAIHLHSGDVVAARALIDRSRPRLSDLVTSRWEDIVRLTEATLLRHEDDAAAAEAILAEVWRTTMASGRQRHAVLSAASLAELYLEARRYREAGIVLESTDRALGGLARPAHLARLHGLRARLLRSEGDLSGAEAELEAAQAAVRTNRLPPERVVWLLEAGQVAVARGHSQRGADLLRDLDEASTRVGLTLPPWERVQRSSLARRCARRATPPSN